MNNIIAGNRNLKRWILFLTTISMKIAGIGRLESEEYAYTKTLQSRHTMIEKTEGKEPQPTCYLRPPLLNHFDFDRVIKKRENDTRLWHDFTHKRSLPFVCL